MLKKMMLKIKVNRLALESKVDMLEYEATTTRSIETDEMTSGWPLTKWSPSHCTESNLTLGGERKMKIMTQYMNNTTSKLQETMELALDLAAVGVSDYVWGDGDESESVPIL